MLLQAPRAVIKSWIHQKWASERLKCIGSSYFIRVSYICLCIRILSVDQTGNRIGKMQPLRNTVLPFYCPCNQFILPQIMQAKGAPSHLSCVLALLGAGLNRLATSRTRTRRSEARSSSMSSCTTKRPLAIFERHWMKLPIFGQQCSSDLSNRCLTVLLLLQVPQQHHPIIVRTRRGRVSFLEVNTWAIMLRESWDRGYDGVACAFVHYSSALQGSAHQSLTTCKLISVSFRVCPVDC